MADQASDWKAGLKAVAERCKARIGAPELSPQGRAQAAIDRALALPIDETKANDATTMIEQFAKDYKDALKRADYRAAGEILNRFQYNFPRSSFGTPRAVPTESERTRQEFLRWGWNADEQSAALAMLKPEERVSSVNWDSFMTTALRKVMRRDVRLSRKLRWDTTDDETFLRREFPPMKKAFKNNADVIEFPGTNAY